MVLNRFNFEQAAINSDELFFRGRQVVNHSEGFATFDQNTTSSRITQVPASGRLHTNVIESIWRDLKSNIAFRHRNKDDAPGKLLEHLWKIENKKDLIDSMYRMIKEVSFSLENNNNDELEPYTFTEAETGETPDEQLVRQQRELRSFEVWTNRRRNIDPNPEDEDKTDDEGAEANDPNYIETPHHRRHIDRSL